MAAQLPQVIVLVEADEEFEVVRDFCFDSHCEYVETEVAGHRGVAMFAGK